jgi:hypothetical protein
VCGVLPRRASLHSHQPGSPWSRGLAAGSRQRAIEFGTRGGGTARRFRRAAWLCACAGSSRRREGKACGQRGAAAGRLPHAAARTAAARRDGTCPAVMRASHIWPAVITAHSQRSSARGAGLPVSEPAGVPAGPAGVLGCWLPGRSGPARDSDRRPRTGRHSPRRCARGAPGTAAVATCHTGAAVLGRPAGSRGGGTARLLTRNRQDACAPRFASAAPEPMRGPL